MILKAPFPWFGGKSRVAEIVWDRFGDVPNYVACKGHWQLAGHCWCEGCGEQREDTPAACAPLAGDICGWRV
jgi:hypothetical protein